MTLKEELLFILKKLKLYPNSGYGKIIITIKDREIVHCEKTESIEVNK